MTRSRTWVGTSWKMTRTIAESRAYAEVLRREARAGGLPEGVQLFVLPAHTAIAAVVEELADVPELWVGAQSAHPGPEGAGTGEVSVRMVAEAGARLVEIGHSERRAARGEDDAFVAACTRAVLDAHLVPLVCVGEPLGVRRAGRAVDHVVAQVRAALSRVAPDEVSRVVVAYEPVWAIGSTGRAAEPDEVASVVAAIAEEGARPAQRDQAGLRALLYGGSVDETTATAILEVPRVDGVFVGRAAWEPRGLLQIARAAAARASPTASWPAAPTITSTATLTLRRPPPEIEPRRPAMTRLFNDPATFSDDALAGFIDASARWVTGVPGGVVRTTRTRAGKVAVVVGGGSGHYPAFWGTVGAGFADGAVAGNVFTSPSAAEAASVGRAADGGAGVVLLTGNYAGDVLNFGLAAEGLTSEGIDTRYVAVTDDIASASLDEIAKRRGIAGDFPVFKAASAAAEEGADLDAVVAAAHRCNDATRSLGVAFAGCTMPGADEPLFTVTPGQMGVGLGIHGEPGISEDPMPTADELAARLVEGVLAEAPDGAGRRVAVILNGLGSTKYDELFVVWGTVARLLRGAGLEIVEPEVGELVTSLDMAGCSLTITWLDEDLERWWRAPADTPGYRKGSMGGPAGEVGEVRGDTEAASAAPAGPTTVPVRDDAAREASRTVVAALEALAGAVAGAEEELGRIDAVAGDGDHGRGMVKGSSAAVEAARSAADDDVAPAGVLAAAADAWAARAGGTSGVLWGALLSGIAGAFDEGAAPTSEQVGRGVTAGYEALVTLGGASLGDKTMLDSLGPFAQSLTERLGAGEDLATAWAAAAEVAVEAGEGTAGMVPKIGRARPLAERSVGTPDAGATSMGLCVTAVAGVLAR